MSQTHTQPAPKTKPLPTLWTVPDALWTVIQGVLDQYDPPKSTGRSRIDPRKAFDGILFRLRTGCQWNQLPSVYGDDSSIHRTFQRWESQGIFDILWAILLTYCEEMGGVDWQWQSADGCMGKARGIAKQAGNPDNGRAAKKGPSRKGSVPIPRIVGSRGSRKAC
jgi:putative transposase